MDLTAIPVLDHHAHGLMRAALPVRPLAEFLTEARDPEQVARHVSNTLAYGRSLRAVAGLLGVDPTEAAVAARREALGREAYARRFIDAARLEAVFIDDGFATDELEPVEWHARFFPVARVLRLEAHAEGLLKRAPALFDFEEAFRTSIDPPPARVVAFKSIAAYRTGLDVRLPDREEAEAGFRAHAAAGGRLVQKPLLDHILGLALEVAARRELPVQFHTGFGDPDLDLRLANPLHLRAVLEEERFRRVAVVLLHASYPFTREAGYLAATYPRVYLDVGLACPLLSAGGMERTLEHLFELAPRSKILYSSDAHHVPELYYLAAQCARDALGTVLERATRARDLTASEAEETAVDVLRGNAARLYGWGRA